jgi:carbon monoxide dehydrogenase subunit G
MAVIRSTVLIDRPTEEVFDFLSDLRNERKWNPGVESMEKVSDGPIGLGTRYLAKWKQSKMVQVECVAFDRPVSWSYHNGGPVEVTFSARLTEENGATRLNVDFDAKPHGFFVLVFPVFLLAMKRQEKANMANLKSALEQRVDHAES